MSRVFSARPVAFAAACLLAALPSLAQTQLEAVLVTATRQPQRVDQALADTTVLDRADIEAFAGRTLVDVLAMQPGLQISNNGGVGRNSGVFLRGLEARHVLLLIDGVRYGSATAGAPSWDNLPLEAIERIEIVRGPLSALYGSDAVGGVVQVFTRTGGKGLLPHAVASIGSHGQRLLGAGLRGGAGSLRYAFALQRQQDDGYSATHAGAPFGYNPDRDGFEQDSANAQLAWTIAPGWELKAVGLHSKGEVQIDDGPGADARAGLRSEVMSLQLAGQISSGWRSSLRVARAEDGYDTLVSASPWTDLGEIVTESTQLAWENQIATPLGSLLLLAERNQQKVSKPGAQNYEVTQRRITGLAAGLQGEAAGHHWQLALRRDRNSQFGSQSTGSAGYGYDINPQLRLTAQAGSSFVAPSFNQLYWPGFGNPLLEPEEGQHKELGLRWKSGSGHSLQLAWYEHRIRGYITGGVSATNLPRTRIEGLSLVWDYVAADWSLNASIDAIDPRNATTANAQFDRLLPRRARDLLRLSAERRLGAWQLAAQLRHVGDRFDNAANTTPLKAYTLLDLRADWQLAEAWKLGLKLNNAADRNYATANGYNQPGREWFLTLRYSGS
jgi:vitamin B12 transporter